MDNLGFTANKTGLGGLVFSEPRSDAEARAVIAKAVELGIRHFDFAEGYGNGHSELIAGQAFSSSSIHNSELFCSSKFYPRRGLKLSRVVEKSLKRLGLERLGILYIHWPRTDLDLRPFAEQMLQLKEEGLIKNIGVSNFTEKDMEAIGELTVPDVHQLPVNILWTQLLEGVIPFSRKLGMKIAAYAPFAQGLLVKPQFSPRKSVHKTWFSHSDNFPILGEIHSRFFSLCMETGLSPVQMCLEFLRQRRDIDGIIAGCSNSDQLSELLYPADVSYSAELDRKISSITEKWRQRIGGVPDFYLRDK